jgi:hypothetical protein
LLLHLLLLNAFVQRLLFHLLHQSLHAVCGTLSAKKKKKKKDFLTVDFFEFFPRLNAYVVGAAGAGGSAIGAA